MSRAARRGAKARKTGRDEYFGWKLNPRRLEDKILLSQVTGHGPSKEGKSGGHQNGNWDNPNWR